MAAKHRPTLRSRWLGQRLRELREQNHKTLREIAEYLQRDPSSISRMEAGIHPARIPDALAYLDVCEISDDEHRKALVQLAKESRQSGWWEQYTEQYSEEYDALLDRIWLESQALRIDSFEAMVIPGHLQLREYAEAAIRASNPDATSSAVERDINLRMERQERIHSDEKLFLNIILDEAVLHRQTGGRAVMRDQLQYLAKISSYPRIRIAVLPFETQKHPSLDGCFDIMRLRDPFSDVAYVFSPAGANFVEGSDVDHLDERFKRLTQLALSPAKSKARCLQLAKG